MEIECEVHALPQVLSFEIDPHDFDGMSDREITLFLIDMAEKNLDQYISIQIPDLSNVIDEIRKSIDNAGQ